MCFVHLKKEREMYCWLVANKPNEQGVDLDYQSKARHDTILPKV
jgi:hypothetical protein